MKTSAEHNSSFATALIKSVRALAMLAALSATVTAWANPNFTLPDPMGTHPLYTSLLAPTGQTFILPGTTNTFNFLDNVATPQPGHWELEIANVFGSPQFFNVTFIYPGGMDVGSVGLGPGGGSIYFDFGYNDAPETGPFTVSLISSANLPFGITVDTDTFETPFATHGVGMAPYFSGGPGGGFNNPGPPSDPSMTFILAPVPEPGSLTLFGLGLTALVGHLWRRKRA
jgi:hypothetical protein